MSFEILHFRGSEKVLKEKNMAKEIKLTMEYLNDVLYGTLRRSELLRQALEEMDWRPKGDLNILEGRRYLYKGLRKRVAIDGNFSSYEFIQDGLLRLQIGRDKGKIDMGILLLTSMRSEKSPYGSTRKLVEQEIEYLYPTISIPVTIVLFDLGKPGLLAEMGAGNGATQNPPEDHKGNAQSAEVVAKDTKDPDPKSDSALGHDDVQGNTVETKAPDPGSAHDDFQEKIGRIEQEGIPTSGQTRMKRWRKTHKKVKPELAQHELSETLPAASSM